MKLQKVASPILGGKGEEMKKRWNRLSHNDRFSIKIIIGGVTLFILMVSYLSYSLETSRADQAQFIQELENQTLPVVDKDNIKVGYIILDGNVGSPSAILWQGPLYIDVADNCTPIFIYGSDEQDQLTVACMGGPSYTIHELRGVMDTGQKLLFHPTMIDTLVHMP